MTAAARAEAARALAAVFDGQQSLELALPRADAKLPDARDRALLRAIVFATLRGIYRYRAQLARLLDKPLKRRDRVGEALLLSGLAQLDAGIAPPYAAVSGCVEAARALGLAPLAGLVNAVLRRQLRELEQSPGGAGPVDDETRYDHPQWLIERLRADWPDDWERILAANNAPAPLWLRVNRTRTTRADYRAALHAAGIAAAETERLADALRVDAPVEIAALPRFADGFVSVQDGAAQLAADLLQPLDGLRVLDACAAPGGKSAHLLERSPQLRLTALDAKAARVRRIAQNLARLGFATDVRVADATQPETWWDGAPYDRILVDAPCSGTGVIRRHPDIRLLRRAGDIAAQVAAQRRLLDALWPLLAPGGRLVYATCSVLPDENARQLASFLERTADAVARPDAVPAWFGVASGPGRQHFPGDDGMDGFYYGVVERRA